MRKLIALAVCAALGGVLATTAFAATKRVTVGDNYFASRTGVPTVTVTKGTYVKWIWRGDKPHNVRVKKGPVKFESPIKTDGSFRKRMRRRGTYKIVCDVHGATDQSMRLVVK